jgi:hypothetical protein
MLLDRILAELAPGTKIPKPAAQGTFKVKGEGTAYGERAILYTIPNRKNPDRPRQKGVTATQLEQAYGQLLRTGELTRAWWNENVRLSDAEGGCNFTTVGGLLTLLGEAEYASVGVYRRRSGA